MRIENIFNLYSFIISIAVLTKSKDSHSILQENSVLTNHGKYINKKIVNLLEQNINRTRFIDSFWCGVKCMLLAF